MGGDSDDIKKLNTLKTVGYNYHNFFPVKVKESGDVKLKFKVKAYRDAIILLSTDKFPDEQAPVYEIVLGGGDNSFSSIRKGRLGEDQTHSDTSDGLVSPNEWTGFWIKVSNDGYVEVGREDEEAFLAWQDPQPFDVNYFSFTSWDDYSALWAFPCFKEHDLSL